MKKKEQTKKEKTLKENLKDSDVNYNILLHLKNISTHLEEIKRINYTTLEILNALYQKFLEEEIPKKEKIQREGTFKNN